MKGLAAILGAIALLGIVPLITSSNVVLNFLVLVFLIALVGQGWNLLGGYGGQYSFGHSAFFGTGAYVTAVLQVRYGVNAWLGLGIGIAAGALVGAAIGALSFRSGLKGSYFALVTLAFAEVLRIIASVAPITGAGVGLLIALDLRPEALQFQGRAPFYWIALGFVGVSLLLARAIEHSRFGAYLIAVRENEDAAEALRGLRLYLPRAALPPAGTEEFYHADLIGLGAVPGDGTAIGRVRAVHDFGAGDTLEIERPAAPPLMVPFTRAVVPVVDLDAGRLVIDPPPGLLDAPRPARRAPHPVRLPASGEREGPADPRAKPEEEGEGQNTKIVARSHRGGAR